MSKNLKNAIILAASAIVGVTLLVVAFIILNPIITDRQKQEKLETINVLFPNADDFVSFNPVTSNSVSVEMIAHVFDGDEALGYFYQANVVNGFGNMRLIVSADLNSVITNVVFLELNQTMHQDTARNIAASYVGITLKGGIADADSGATSVSAQSVMELMRVIGDVHEDIEKLPAPTLSFLETIFGEGYEVTETNNLTQDGATVVVETIGSQGYAYTIDKSGISKSFDSTESSIRLVIAMDTDGKILGVDLPIEYYFHTTSATWRNPTVEYANTFVGTNISSVVDQYAGTTDDGGPYNSRRLVHAMFVAAREVFEL